MGCDQEYKFNFTVTGGEKDQDEDTPEKQHRTSGRKRKAEGEEWRTTFFSSTII